MKKEYKAPQAAKVEFDYSEVVVASTGCRWVIPMGDNYRDCVEHPKGAGEANDILN